MDFTDLNKYWRGFALLVVMLTFGALTSASPKPQAPWAVPPELHLERQAGKVVIVDFWASWCKPCRQSIPWLNEMRSRYAAQGLVIIGVNVDAKRDDADEFLRDVPMQFEQVFDQRGDLAAHFELKGMPSSFVFDRDGKIADRHLGFREADKAAYESSLQRLLSRHNPQAEKSP